MQSLKVAAAALALTTFASATLPGAVTPAEAKKVIIVKGGGHHHHHGFYRGFYGPTLLLASGAGYGGCYWLKRRAIESGSSYWWNRYYACRAD
jgi:hypothetical protein